MIYKHCSDKEKKAIIADYIELQNLRAVGRKHKRSATTIKNIIRKNPEVLQMCAEKKEENSQEILEYMDTKKDIVCKMIDLYLDEFCNDNRIKSTPLAQLGTVFGIVIDKFTPKDIQANVEVENLTVLKDLLKE